MNLMQGRYSLVVSGLAWFGVLMTWPAPPVEASASMTSTDRWGGQGRSFQKEPNGTWAEYLNGKRIFGFTEVTRDQNSVHLHDKGRNVSVLLTASKAEVSEKGKFQFAYEGRFFYSVFAHKLGAFYDRGGNRWEEMQNGKVAYRFVQTGRTMTSVTLYDDSRGLTVVLNMTDFRILSGNKELGKVPGKWVQ
jgi:hypothetical protein